MELQTYMKIYKLSINEIAKRTGLSKPTVWKITKRAISPRLKDAFTITELTCHYVTFRDLLSIEDLTALRERLEKQTKRGFASCPRTREFLNALPPEQMSFEPFAGLDEEVMDNE